MTQPTAKITHPERPDIWVEARMPRAIDDYERKRQQEQFVRPIAVERADGSIVIDHNTGRPYVHVHEGRTPAKMLCDLMFPHLTNWSITDAHGNAVPFDRQNMSELFEDHLRVPRKAWLVRQNGEWVARDNGDPFVAEGVTYTPTQETYNQQFILYATEALWKKETFDSDPTGKSSPSP